MKVNFKNMMLLLFGLLIPYGVLGMSTIDANAGIDIEKNSNVLLNYNYDDSEFNDVGVKVYYVASIDEEMQYHVSSSFLDYPMKINGIKTNDEWGILKDTIDAYIVADDIKETLSFSIVDNKVEIDDLRPGLYFVKTDKIENEDYSLLFDDFLLSVPGLDEDGNWDYDVVVNSKAEEYIKKYEKVNYVVIKEWVDNQDERPDSVDIEIYKNGKLYNSQVLSSENNWTYQWEVDTDGSEWMVVEREVPDGYNVSILERENKFIIVNTDSDYEVDNPQTVDNINLYFYLLVGSLVLIMVLVIGLVMRNKSQR